MLLSLRCCTAYCAADHVQHKETPSVQQSQHTLHSKSITRIEHAGSHGVLVAVKSDALAQQLQSLLADLVKAEARAFVVVPPLDAHQLNLGALQQQANTNTPPPAFLCSPFAERQCTSHPNNHVCGPNHNQHIPYMYVCRLCW